MYAIVEQGGQQFKVSEGDRLDIDLTQVEEGAKSLEMGKVLMISDGENIKVGTPYLDGAKVTASLTAETAEESVVKGPKLYPTHFRRRKNSRRRIGHRQKYLRVTIDKIEG